VSNIEVVTVRYGVLRTFFLTRFHEDWHLDAGSRADVVDDFVSTENPVFVERVVNDLRSLLADEVPEDELHQSMLREYGLSFDPWKHEMLSPFPLRWTSFVHESWNRRRGSPG
jgi:hypothetical protein